jgi:hypothetical protein
VDDGLHLRLARVDDPERGEVGPAVLESGNGCEKSKKSLANFSIHSLSISRAKTLRKTHKSQILSS